MSAVQSLNSLPVHMGTGGGKGGKGGKVGGKGGKVGGKGGKVSGSSKKNPTSRSHRAGIVFPVGRIHRLLKSRVTASSRVGAAAAVCTAAVLEYLTCELLELSSFFAKDNKAKRISPRHIQLAICSDEEVKQIITAVIAGGGVQPSVLSEVSGKDGKDGKKPAASAPVGPPSQMMPVGMHQGPRVTPTMPYNPQVGTYNTQ
eukprot:GDKJ01015814.1.p2 GENE.GDKJ01015814.1~~GDKJ01015814.1.p2  ORF type:complete len:201 (-),score=66.37 GDKJ01015814.1:160-762(-)